MRALIAKIQIGRKQLNLDRFGYESILFQVTGKASSKDLTRSEAIAVIKEFERRGFRGNRSPAPASTATGKYAPVLRALWLSAHNLGIARSADDKALIAFVQRQTGVSHTRFLADEQDARKAIEGLKRWITRESGVVWPGKGALEAKRAIVIAQWRRLVALGAVTLMSGADDLDGLGEYVGQTARGYKRRIGDIYDGTVTAEELDTAQAALGRKLRAALAAKGGT